MTAHPKVADFGLAKLGGVTSFKTRTGVVVGTPQYMSPEHAQAQEPTTQSDVYAMGVLIFEITTGSVPFDGANDLGILLQHVQDQPPLITDIDPTLDEDLAELIDRCLEKKKEDRPQRASEVARRLRRVIKGLSMTKGKSKGKAKRSRQLRQQKRSGLDVTKDLSKLSNPDFQDKRRSFFFAGLVFVPIILTILFYSFRSNTTPSIIEKFKVEKVGAHTALLSWRGSWSSKNFRLFLKKKGEQDGEKRNVEIIESTEPGVGSRCPYSFIVKLAGLDAQSKYSLSLFKQDGQTTLSIPLNTNREQDFSPNLRLELGDAGQLKVSVEGRTPFRCSFEPSRKGEDVNFYERQHSHQFGLHSLKPNGLITCKALSIDGAEKTIDVNVLKELKTIAQEAKEAFWQARERAAVHKHLNSRFLRPWEKKLSARDEAGKREKKKIAGPFFNQLQSKMGLATWYRKLEPLLPGVGALLVSPLMDEELRQTLSQALIPLELTARTIQYMNLPVPPSWERAVTAERRPYPLRFNTATSLSLTHVFESTGQISSPFYCLMDGRHHVLPMLYPNPDLAKEITQRRMSVNLTNEELAGSSRAELYLSFRLVRIQIMVLVEVNGRSFVASYAAREQELRDYRELAIELNTDYRISEMMLAAGKPTDVKSARGTIEPLDAALPKKEWHMCHDLPLKYLKPGKNEVLLYPIQSRLEGLETVCITRLGLKLIP